MFDYQLFERAWGVRCDLPVRDSERRVTEDEDESDAEADDSRYGELGIGVREHRSEHGTKPAESEQE